MTEPLRRRLASDQWPEPQRAKEREEQRRPDPPGGETEPSRGPEYPLLVIVGPTASGKTALAIRLAKALAPGLNADADRHGARGEIVSCDSVAVYRSMEIGTAKPTAEERAQVPHHGLDLYWPDQECTAGDYARHARHALEEIHARGKIAILTGGSGLYLRAVLEGLAPAPQRNEPLRVRLRDRAARSGDPRWLHRVLQRLDPRAAELIHAHDTPKLIRSIEVTLAGRQPQTQQWQAGRAPLRGYRVLQLGLDPPRAALYARINVRAAAMFDAGLLEETASLRTSFGDSCRALGAQGYAQATELLRGRCTREAAIAAAQQGHRNYAKRQLTWFRREAAIEWLPGFGDDPAVQDEALRRVVAHCQQAPS